MPVDVLSAIQDKLFGSTRKSAVGVQQAEMADARKGILYFLGNTRAESVQKGFSFSTAVTFGAAGAATMPSDLIALPTWLYQQTVGRSALGQCLSEMTDIAADEMRKIDKVISDFFAWAIDQLVSFFGRFSTTVSNFLLTISNDALVVLFATVVSTAIKSSIPSWGHSKAGAQVYSGLLHAFQGAKSFFSQLWSGRNVDLLGGHPSIIANALARHSLASVGGGIMEVGVNMGIVAGATAGAALGTLPVILMFGFYEIVSWIEGVIQRYLVNKTFTKAREVWPAIKRHEANNAVSAPLLMSDHNAFSCWFRDAVISCPIIAALTVCSGFAANPLRFLQILDEALLGRLANESDPDLIHTSQVETARMQAKFTAGERHINHLQTLGLKYIPKYCAEYHVEFYSADSVVAARLNTMMMGVIPQRLPEKPPAYKPEDKFQLEDHRRHYGYMGGPIG